MHFRLIHEMAKLHHDSGLAMDDDIRASIRFVLIDSGLIDDVERISNLIDLPDSANQ